jgi:hypothetical protein
VNSKLSLAAAVMVGVCATAAIGQESAKQLEWDQAKAIQKVKELIALEETGDFPWEKIAWQTDPNKAAALAQKEQKPIFVYFFLKRNVGPAAAPC